MAAVRAAGLILLLASAPAPAQTGGAGAGSAWDQEVFPEADQVFARLLADPRRVQTSARYYRLNGRNIGDVALGNTWGLLRWTKGDVAVQWNVEGMAYSRFKVAGGVNEFETVDFFLNLPLDVRRGPFSGQLVLFHESSHLGDDYIRRTGDVGFRYSVEGVRALASAELARLLRLYAGPTFLIHTVPGQPSGSLQWGLELRSAELKRWMRHPFYLYLAQDFHAKSQVKWNVNSNTEVGVRLAFDQVIRSMRVFTGYFEGHSPFGQFYREREHYWNLGISFDF